MRPLYIITFVYMLLGCEPAADCLKSSGDETTVELTVEPFTAIEINSEFNVILQEGPEQKLQLTTGENLVSEIDFKVIDETFIINNSMSCNWTRSYDFPTLTIVHPNIREIRQGGSGVIASKGVLHYPNLHLVSEDQSGDFRLEVESDVITVSNNDVTNFYLSGQCNDLNVSFHSGDGRFEGGDLRVMNAEISHCGSNDIIIYATDELKGKLCASGNLIYVKTVPQLIDVSTVSKGRVVNRTE